MSYCKKKGIEPTVCYCLACEYCLPPAERIGGRMCENEIMDKQKDGDMKQTEEIKAMIREMMNQEMEDFKEAVNNDVVCGIYCIAGYVCALLFMPSLKVAMFIWGLCCAIDNIGWLVVYHRNKDKFTED